MICPKYVSHRAKISQHLNNNTNFASQSYVSKFNWPLSNGDATVRKDIARFVTVCIWLLVHEPDKFLLPVMESKSNNTFL